MCFDEDAIPPVPQVPDAAVESRYLELTAADGNTFAAFTVAPAGGTRTAIVILPDVRGLYGFYTELANASRRTAYGRSSSTTTAARRARPEGKAISRTPSTWPGSPRASSTPT